MIETCDKTRYGKYVSKVLFTRLNVKFFFARLDEKVLFKKLEA